MSGLLNAVVVAIAIAGMFLLLIAPHEAGHFLLAKLFKVHVIEFSIGAGTRLWSMTRNGTLYAIRLIPVIGYVRMGGMEAGDFDEPNGFHSKNPLQRIAILLAGPMANFVVAALLVTGLNLTHVNSDPGKIGAIVKDSPAAAAGLQAGDSIRTVNGTPMKAATDLQKAAGAGVPVVITGVHPDGTRFSLQVSPNCSTGPCRIGVFITPTETLQTALHDGVTFPLTAFNVIWQGLESLVTGQVPGGLFGKEGLTGPIGIAAVTYTAVNQGPDDYIVLVAILSVALGVTNLLPLLALDGGRIVVVVIEWLRRRPFDRNSELNFQRWGLVALLALAVVISFLDIQRIATGQFNGVH
ncbi:MAG TPA: M50 family metallopeptidase [Candidatus Dormibacteraeota bacterium]|nr:M50 family metallopeptidase [Candidatus Dormibacteraeota bacterium]